MDRLGMIIKDKASERSTAVDQLTHFNPEGRARMVDVSKKTETERMAIAEARLVMQPETLKRIVTGETKKGDVLAVAQVAGVMGAKRTADWIPMCHPLPLTGVDLTFAVSDERTLLIRAHVRTTYKTGVEMEALTAVSAAALTVYDMVKSMDRAMVIETIRLLYKSGGKSGEFRADGLEDL